MDLNDISRAERAAREFTHGIGAVTYTVRVPTPHEVDCAAADSGGVLSAGGMVRTQRALLERGVVGWAGLTERMLLPGHKHASDEPVPWAREAVPLLLDLLPAVADALWPLLSERLVKRGEAAEAARKN